MKVSFKSQLVGGLLVLLALSACGTAPSATSLSTESDLGFVADAKTGLKYALGADISHDPGVSYDGDDLSVQAASADRADLRDGCSPVANQGQFGACTSFATVKGLQEYLLKQQHRFVPQSPAFIWYESRRQQGGKGKDTGVPTEFAVKMLDAYGTVPEAEFPYLDLKLHKDEKARDEFLNAQPGAALEKEAKHNRLISGYKLVTKLSGIRKSLSSGVPVVLAMRVFQSIGKTGHDGVLPMPTANDKMVGGHAVLCVGYDDEKRFLIVRNSWGPDWADDGYFYMSYDYFRMGGVRLAVVPKL